MRGCGVGGSGRESFSLSLAFHVSFLVLGFSLDRFLCVCVIASECVLSLACFLSSRIVMYSLLA